MLKNKKIYYIFITVVIFIFLFTLITMNKPKTYDKNTIRYAVIGDSYSNGEGATPEESWPSVLTKDLKMKGINIELVSNPSITGWTSKQAIDQELPEYEKSSPTFATLLIGVNDWVQGVDATAFRKNLITLIDRMQSRLPDKSKMIIVTIPDFSKTPTGNNYSQGRDISHGILSFNKIIMEEAGKRNITVIDIYPLSQKVSGDSELVAQDGLHPSAKEYTLWEQLIYPEVYKILKK